MLLGWLCTLDLIHDDVATLQAMRAAETPPERGSCLRVWPFFASYLKQLRWHQKLKYGTPHGIGSNSTLEHEFCSSAIPEQEQEQSNGSVD